MVEKKSKKGGYKKKIPYKDRPLTPKQRLFVDHYMQTLNSTESAEKAGYAGTTMGPQLIRFPNVKNAIAIRQAKLANKMEITTTRTLEEIARNAFSDVADLFDEKGTLLHPTKIPEHTRRSISSVKVKVTDIKNPITGKKIGEEQVIEYKFWDKVKSLENLGKHLGLFPKDKAKDDEPGEASISYRWIEKLPMELRSQLFKAVYEQQVAQPVLLPPNLKDIGRTPEEMDDDE